MLLTSVFLHVTKAIWNFNSFYFCHNTKPGSLALEDIFAGALCLVTHEVFLTATVTHVTVRFPGYTDSDSSIMMTALIS